MKKLLFIFLFPAFLFSCALEEDPIFDKSATERMNDAMANVRNILVSAQNGWQADYYPYANYAQGGFAMYLDFYSDGKVDVMCEVNTNVPARQKETSLFNIFADQGPVLSFNTYNKVMHYWSEPISSSQTTGRAGDYEFIVMSATPDKVVLKGKKRGNRLVLYRNVTAVNRDAYLRAAANLAIDLSPFGIFSLTLNGTKRGEASVSYRNFTNFTYEEDGKEEIKRLSYAFTGDGIRLYEPFTIDGITMERFVWDDATKRLNCVEPAGVTAYFTGALDPNHSLLYYNDYIGTYTMDFATSQAAPPARTRTTTITIEAADPAERTYYVRGFMYPADEENANIIAVYNVQRGTLSMNAQLIFVNAANEYVWLTPWTQASNISTAAAYGMVSSNHALTPTISFELVNNQAWTAQTIAGFALYRWTANTATIGWYGSNTAPNFTAICYPIFTKQ